MKEWFQGSGNLEDLEEVRDEEKWLREILGVGGCGMVEEWLLVVWVYLFEYNSVLPQASCSSVLATLNLN